MSSRLEQLKEWYPRANLEGVILARDGSPLWAEVPEEVKTALMENTVSWYAIRSSSGFIEDETVDGWFVFLEHWELMEPSPFAWVRNDGTFYHKYGWVDAGKYLNFQAWGETVSVCSEVVGALNPDPNHA